MAQLLSDRIAWFALPAIAGCVASLAIGISPARADAFKVSFEAAGVQNASTTALCANTGAGPCTIGVESFDTRASNASFTTNFGTGSAITGTYSGVPISAADQYGGAGGTGKYPAAISTAPYSVALTTTLTTGINYFGFWLSALDSGNQVAFYKTMCCFTTSRRTTSLPRWARAAPQTHTAAIRMPSFPKATTPSFMPS